MRQWCYLYFFFFNDTATTEIYTLSLHDALPICLVSLQIGAHATLKVEAEPRRLGDWLAHEDEVGGQPDQDDHETQDDKVVRSEEHTSELQSRQYLVCRLLLEKNKHIVTFLHSNA